MLSRLQRELNAYNRRITLDEVENRLSFTIWKTKNRIVEEVKAVRVLSGTKPPVEDRDLSYGDIYWTTLDHLTTLIYDGTALVTQAHFLTDQEAAWASTSDSVEDAEADSRGHLLNTEYGVEYHGLHLYKLALPPHGKKVNREFLPNLDPIVLRSISYYPETLIL